MSREQLLKQLYSVKEWRQRIRLYDNVFTPGTRCEDEWDFIYLPADLKGKTFLDVGANDGMFSFIAETRNAKRVCATDLFVEDNDTNLKMTTGWSVSRIRKIKEIKNSSVEVVPASIYDLSPVKDRYDVVFCGNVIAWLDAPVTAIKQLAEKCDETLIIREDISKLKGKPVLEYVNNEKLTGCYFMGNREFYKRLLTSLGFKKIQFKEINTFEIFKKRSDEFKKVIVPAGTPCWSHPFEDAVQFDSTGKVAELNAMVLNGKGFINRLGWVETKYFQSLPEAIPVNPIKKEMYKLARKKSIPDHYTIIAQR